MTAAELATHIGGYAATIDAPVHTRTNVTSGARRLGRLRRRDRSGTLAVRGVGDRQRALQLGAAAGSRRRPCRRRSPFAPRWTTGHRPLGRRRRARRRRLGHGRPAGRGDPPLGSARDARCRRARPHATHLPGRDIFWWTDAAGILDERYDEVDDLVRARRLPSPQLVGSPDRRSIDLNTSPREGITIVGRLGRITDGVAQFSGSLTNTCALADLKMNRLLDRLDTWAQRPTPTSTRPNGSGPPQVLRPPLEVDLRRAGISHRAVRNRIPAGLLAGSTFPCSTGAAASSTTAA